MCLCEYAVEHLWFFFFFLVVVVKLDLVDGVFVYSLQIASCGVLFFPA